MKTKATIIALLLTITICSVWAGWFLTIENPDNVMGVNASFITGVNISTGGGTPVNYTDTISNNLSDELAYYWSLDETSGLISIDRTNNANGTISANLEINEVGIQGRAYRFNETDDKVSYGNGVESITDEITISVWSKKDKATTSVLPSDGESFIFSKRESAASNPFNTFVISAINGGTNVRELLSVDGTYYYKDVSVPDTNWHLYSITYDGALITFYLDAVQTHNASATGSITHSNTYELTSGDIEVGGVRYYEGVTDEMGIWNISLNQTQIEMIYNNGNGIPYN